MTLCSAVFTRQFIVVQSNAVHSSPVQFIAVQFNALQIRAVSFSVAQCSAVKYSADQCSLRLQWTVCSDQLMTHNDHLGQIRAGWLHLTSSGRQ